MGTTCACGKRGGVVGSTANKKRPFEEIDVFPLTFEPEMTWGRCFEKEASGTKVDVSLRRRGSLIMPKRSDR